MSVTPRPRRAFVSNSGESNNTLPHSMGRIYNLGNLREFLSHLLLSHKIRLFQDMSRLIIDRDRHSIRVHSFSNFHREIFQRVLNIADTCSDLEKLALQLASYGSEKSSNRGPTLAHVA